MNNLTNIMVEHLNLKLKEEGSCLRYVVSFKDGSVTSYRVIVEDKYVDNTYSNVNVTKDFEDMVRKFFKGYDVENTGFSNTVSVLMAWE